MSLRIPRPLRPRSLRTGPQLVSLRVPRRRLTDNLVKRRHQRMRRPRFHPQKRELIRGTLRLHRRPVQTLPLGKSHPQKEMLVVIRGDRLREPKQGMPERLRLRRIRLVVIRQVLDLIELFRWASNQIRFVRSISVILTVDRLAVTQLARMPVGTEKPDCDSAAL